MYLPAKPVGVYPPNPEQNMPLWKVVSGDDWTLTTRITVPPAMKEGARPENSRVICMVAQDRFSQTPIWTGRWQDGILLVNPTEHPGLVVIRIPDSVAVTLRRGAYSFSITVADVFGRHVTTVLTGTLQVEYEPTSPQHNVPYRNDTSPGVIPNV